MAKGSTRLVRYVVFAVFTLTSAFSFQALALFYFVSNSKYNGVTVHPGDFKGRWDNSQSQDRAPTDQEQEAPLRSGSDSTAGDTSGDSSEYYPKDREEWGVTSKARIAEMGKQFPLAMNPNDPGWDNLMSTAPGPRMNATFVTLARNSDVYDIAKSIRQVEDRFNRRYNYDWVFLNDKPFDDTFKKVTSSLASGKTHYGLIPKEHWSYPEWIDRDRAKKVREDMKARKIIYGDSVSYRHMCRYESGFFFRHPLMLNYEYYWRVEPSIELFCDVHYDPFRVLVEEDKKYSFVLSLYEYGETIKTLWDSTKKFMKNHPEHIAPDNSLEFLSDDDGETYNNCHFWSNFEIGSLDWLRSKSYIDFFESLDKDGGFFYERWGDAPVHSIAAGLLLKKDEIKFFNDIAYYHVPFTHCPTGEQTRLDLRCHCNPKDNFDWKTYSCTSRYFDLNGLKKPEGHDSEHK
ncbi:Alpha-1,2 mannosyltransferase-like protein [Hapsidospora chrysogenum ATCC 11550]|uniref:Alpha-1,2 mannosyltransferase-like protein n=1 Tax=Hapsidospora chrysogenum (strain ATCC 11550 / CBS 779.69 / DSM 880 / IAM 14645 / JCM 23072 / IMI 49137) TaxID=857340 RepID=A0A086T759_HAPC1|nr:Alpha-1,2 mannosyltransferase-like protein [Hapsidospora chrysogenum ATCC 11550]